MIGNPLFSLYASHEKMTTMECAANDSLKRYSTNYTLGKKKQTGNCFH